MYKYCYLLLLRLNKTCCVSPCFKTLCKCCSHIIPTSTYTNTYKSKIIMLIVPLIAAVKMLYMSFLALFVNYYMSAKQVV